MGWAARREESRADATYSEVKDEIQVIHDEKWTDCEKWYVASNGFNFYELFCMIMPYEGLLNFTLSG